MKLFTTPQMFVKILGISFIAITAIFGIFSTTKIKAQSNANPYSGTCAGIFNLGNSHEVAYRQTENSIDIELINASIMIDFSSNKAYIVGNEANFQPGDNITYRLKNATNKDVIFTDYAAMPGSKKGIIDTSSELGGQVEFLIIPVNSGNIFLIQGVNFGASGVCQKV
jgi:hypothetical protein